MTIFDFTFTVVSQFVVILGFLVVPAYGIYVVGIGINRIYIQEIGYRRTILFSGWFGTPVHELSHALMARIFLFKIHEIKLFTPNTVDGTLGYVAYSPRGPMYIRQTGQFLVALAPYVGGGFFLYLLLRIFVPETDILLDGTRSILQRSSLSLLETIVSLLWAFICNMSFIFEQLDFTNWQHILFLYFAVAISAHMAPSRVDFEHSRKGMLWCMAGVGACILLNTMVFNNRLDPMLIGLRNLIAVPSALLIMAMTLGGMTLVLSWVLLKVYRVWVRR